MAAPPPPPPPAPPVVRQNRRTAAYREMFAALPAAIQALADRKFVEFVANPDHPSLRRHLLRDNGRGRHRPASYSVSITMQYRAIYFEDGDTNVWYWVGTHAAYDAFVGSS